MAYLAEHRWLWKPYVFLLQCAARLWRALLLRTTVVAVTGSVGKSTTVRCLTAILASQASAVGSVRNQNGGHGVARTLLRVRPWTRFVVVEIGVAKRGSMAGLASIVRPHVAVITNVQVQHLSVFGSLEGIAAEKAALLAHIRPGGHAVLNGDDPRVVAMRPGPGRRVTRYGRAEGFPVRVLEARSTWPQRLELRVRAGEQETVVRTRLVGVHWTHSVLAALAASQVCGVPLDVAARALESVEPDPARLQPVALPGGATLWRDDYNGGIEPLEAALEALREARAERKIVITGKISDSGEAPEARARRAGRLIASVADVAVALGPWRSEVLAGARSGENRRIELHAFESLQDAAGFLRRLLRKGDLALLSGYFSDHITRLYFSQWGEVACWKQICGRHYLCDQCPDLGFRPFPKSHGHEPRP